LTTAIAATTSGVRSRAEPAHDRVRTQHADDREQQTESGRQVEPVDPPRQALLAPSGSNEPGDLRGGAVGEEDAHVDERVQGGSGCAGPGELGGA
jgi:hypothetical protein